ncbi:MAG: LysM peptidoglycan-binding domain-containing protein [Steroidobacteraceae bacterium]|nr:LysM peptidoglycan-binding domain-containing protein [Deltaproteobacteria bacterium]
MTLPPLRRTAVTVLLCSLALPAWGQQYFIYEPRPVIQDAKGQTKNGILVKEIPIKEGDTLYDISRKFSGHGMYYPQILLFNEIKNPDLIHTGDSLKIPLPHGEPPRVPASAGRAHKKVQKHPHKAERKSPIGAVRPRKNRLPAAAVKKSAENPAELSLSELKRIGGGTDRKPAKSRKSADRTTIQKGDDHPSAVAQPRVEPTPQSREIAAPRSAAADTAAQQLFQKAVKAYKQDDWRTALELFDRYLAENPASPLAADASLYKAECYMKLSAQ